MTCAEARYLSCLLCVAGRSSGGNRRVRPACRQSGGPAKSRRRRCFFEIDGPAGVEACRTAVEMRPDLPRFRYQLALAFARMKQFAEAAAAIRPAAEASYAAAQADLGYMLRNGLGVDLDAGAALRWSMLAAQQGYSPAMNDVGFSYANGLDATADFEQALASWFSKVAARRWTGRTQSNCSSGLRRRRSPKRWSSSDDFRRSR